MKAGQALLPATGPAKLKPLAAHESAIIYAEIRQSALWLMATLTPEHARNRRITCVTGGKSAQLFKLWIF